MRFRKFSYAKTIMLKVWNLWPELCLFIFSIHFLNSKRTLTFVPPAFIPSLWSKQSGSVNRNERNADVVLFRDENRTIVTRTASWFCYFYQLGKQKSCVSVNCASAIFCPVTFSSVQFSSFSVANSTEIRLSRLSLLFQPWFCLSFFCGKQTDSARLKLNLMWIRLSFVCSPEIAWNASFQLAAVQPMKFVKTPN